MEVVEASTEVVEVFTTTMEVSTASAETSTSMEAASSVEVIGGSVRGSAQWKLPWKHPRNKIYFHWLPRSSIGDKLLPQPSWCVWKLPLLPWELPFLPLLPWKLPWKRPVSGSFHCFHESFHCFHCFRGSVHGSRFRGSKWALPWKLSRKLPRQLLLEASTTSIGACFASIEASRSLHRFRRSFHLQRNSLA